MSDIYKQAIRQNVRFDFKGLRSVEDLWGLSLEELDGIFQALNSQRKAKSEESLLKTKTNESTELDLKLAIVKDIVETMLKEQDERQDLAAKAIQKEKIMRIIAQKSDSALESQSIEELQAMLASL